MLKTTFFPQKWDILVVFGQKLAFFDLSERQILFYVWMKCYNVKLDWFSQNNGKNVIFDIF